jgi:MarR family
MIGVPSWSDSTDEHSAGPASACAAPASNDQMITRCEQAMPYMEPVRPLPGRLTNLPAAELGRRWGWRRQRASRRLKAWQKAGLVTRCGNVVMMADGSPKAGIDLAAYVAAIFLAGAAAFFSIQGMVVLFPGASLAVVVMAFAKGPSS